MRLTQGVSWGNFQSDRDAADNQALPAAGPHRQVRLYAQAHLRGRAPRHVRVAVSYLPGTSVEEITSPRAHAPGLRREHHDVTLKESRT